MALDISNPNGQLPNAKATLYTTPGEKSYVKSIVLKNTGGAAETVQIYFNASGVSREIPTIILGVDESATIDATGLGSGGTIEGFSTNAAVVDYFMCVVQESR